MHHYYILTTNPYYKDVTYWVVEQKLQYSVHLNRTRFLVPDGWVLTNFLLRFAHCCSRVDDTLDLATGLPI